MASMAVSCVVVNSQASNHMDLSRFSRAALAGAALLVAAVPASAEPGRLWRPVRQCHAPNGPGRASNKSLARTSSMT